jgi:hypothetical protein
MIKDSIPTVALMKSAGKHTRDRKNLTTDETPKPVFENHLTRNKSCFTGNGSHLTGDETRLGREIAKNSGETYPISQEMKNFSGEMKPVTGEIFFISRMFFQSIRTKISNSNIISN